MEDSLSCYPITPLESQEDRDAYLNICVPLYIASIRGDWEAAQVIFAKNHDLVGYGITENYETALHIAASAKSSKAMHNFVKNLVDKMTEKQLELTNKNSNTALCLAAQAGNVNIAMIILEKNPNLVDIPGASQMMPLYVASLFGKKDMIDYLYGKSRKMKGDGVWSNRTRGWVVQKCVESDIFDIALKILTDSPTLIIDVDKAVLGVLAQKPGAFWITKPSFFWRIILFLDIYVNFGPAEKPSDAVELLRFIWKRILKYPKDKINESISGSVDKPPASRKEDVVQLLETISEDVVKLHESLHNHWKPSADGSKPQDGRQVQNPGGPQVQNLPKNYSFRILFAAAEMGNTGFLVELLRQYPDLIWRKNHNNHTIFHIAITFRHEGIFNLLQEIGSMKEIITSITDQSGNTMLHLAGKIANEKTLHTVSGVALQMQRELVWFKQVKSMIPLTYLDVKNNDGLTAHELFSKEHKDLLSEGEKWMIGTASQSMVVAALIATIVFAAAFTVPGGYNQNNGVPMFLHNRYFIVFVISDAISLTCSSISILIFLSILTSRYAEEDFVELLPNRLLKGLVTLFFSIVAMMVAFGQSFFVLYRNNLLWVPIVVSVIVSMPVIFFAKLHYGLLKDFYHSANGYKSLFKQNESMIHYQNPKL
ncbi:hypothetical protein LXL04_023753 [Taraxacum kok-saghyz]